MHMLILLQTFSIVTFSIICLFYYLLVLICRTNESVSCGTEEDTGAGVERLVHQIQRSTHY